MVPLTSISRRKHAAGNLPARQVTKANLGEQSQRDCTARPYGYSFFRKDLCSRLSLSCDESAVTIQPFMNCNWTRELLVVLRTIPTLQCGSAL